MEWPLWWIIEEGKIKMVQTSTCEKKDRLCLTKRSGKLAIAGVRKSRGRLKKSWREMIKQDMTHLQLIEEMTLNGRYESWGLGQKVSWSSIVWCNFQYCYYSSHTILVLRFWYYPMVHLHQLSYYFVLASVLFYIVFSMAFFAIVIFWHTVFLYVLFESIIYRK